jgi:hypothetical protein
VTSERTVERALVAAVTAAGGVAYKFTSPSRRGVPDRLIVLPGNRIFFAEVKGDGGRLAPLQAVETERLRKLGARVDIVSSIAQAREIVG